MADHPILFKSEMIRAIRDGCKTQTRRVIKRLWIHDDYGEPDWNKTWIDDSYNPPCLKVAYGGGLMGGTVQRHWCQYVPGDLLWVREPFTVTDISQWARMKGYYTRDGQTFNKTLTAEEYNKCCLWKKATLFRGKSSLFMFKSLARLWLKVKSVRVERVQEISDEDVVSEGIESFGWDFAESSDGTGQKFMYWADVSRDMPNWCPDGTTSCECATDIFSYLWDSINAKPRPRYRKKEITHYESYPWKNIHQTRRHRGKPWHVYGNPHIFATEFERYEQ